MEEDLSGCDNGGTALGKVEGTTMSSGGSPPTLAGGPEKDSEGF